MGRKLTKRVVDAATTDVWDGEHRGLGVRVHPTGKKTFVLNYRMPGSRLARRYTLGEYGKLTVEQARNEGQRLLASIKLGVDPAAEKAARREAPTVREFSAKYLEHVRAYKKPRTADEYERQLKRYVLPVFGSMKVGDVTTTQVAALHLRMSTTPTGANRVLAMIGSFFRFAELDGARAKGTNPARGVTRYPEHERERFLTPEEVVRLGDALTRAEREGLPPAPTRQKRPATGPTRKHRPKSADKPKPANPLVVALIRFLLLSGWRAGEALTLRWSDVDFTRGVVTLPDTKTRKSVRVLGAPALLLLSDLARIEGNPYVFAGRQDGAPLRVITRVWYAVRHAAGLDGLRLHDLRYSFASVPASNGESLLVAGKLLGHKNARTTQRYAHLLDDPVKRAADATAAQLADLLAGGSKGATPLRLAR